MRCYQAQTAVLAAGSAAPILLALMLLVSAAWQLPGGACGQGAHDRSRAHRHLGADADAAADSQPGPGSVPAVATRLPRGPHSRCLRHRAQGGHIQGPGHPGLQRRAGPRRLLQNRLGLTRSPARREQTGGSAGTHCGEDHPLWVRRIPGHPIIRGDQHGQHLLFLGHPGTERVQGVGWARDDRPRPVDHTGNQGA